MDFTKKVNDFGLFGNVLVVNNNVIESVSVIKTDEDKKVLAAALTLLVKLLVIKLKRENLILLKD